MVYQSGFDTIKLCHVKSVGSTCFGPQIYHTWRFQASIHVLDHGFTKTRMHVRKYLISIDILSRSSQRWQRTMFFSQPGLGKQWETHPEMVDSAWPRLIIGGI